MSQDKYIGMDVDDAAISAAVKNAEGKLLMEFVLETKAATILEFIQGLRGTPALTFEEGTMAVWLHDLLKPHRACFQRTLAVQPAHRIASDEQVLAGVIRADENPFDDIVCIQKEIPLRVHGLDATVTETNPPSLHSANPQRGYPVGELPGHRRVDGSSARSGFH